MLREGGKLTATIAFNGRVPKADDLRLTRQRRDTQRRIKSS